jgi:nitronate monooxygenase
VRSALRRKRWNSLNPTLADRHRDYAPSITKPHPALSRAQAFCDRFGLRVPILLAPMAGASPPSLSIAVMNAGGLGACGALLMQPRAIVDWAAEVRAGSGCPFQLNLWMPDPAPVRDTAREDQVRRFLAQWGPAVPSTAGDNAPPDFIAQCNALLDAAPPIVSSVMGLYRPEVVSRLKAQRIAWFANISTLAEARLAEAAGADVVVVQGMEAGGHRGCFDAASAEREMVGLFALVPAVVDAVRIPVVATGGIADGRGVAAALLLGASAAQIGTGFLRCPEAKLHPAWADALAVTTPYRSESGVQWARWAQHRDRLRPRRDRTGCSRACPVSGTAGADLGDARGRQQGIRRPAHAGLGRTVRRPRPSRACGQGRAPRLAGSTGAPGLGAAKGASVELEFWIGPLWDHATREQRGVASRPTQHGFDLRASVAGPTERGRRMARLPEWQ